MFGRSKRVCSWAAISTEGSRNQYLCHGGCAEERKLRMSMWVCGSTTGIWEDLFLLVWGLARRFIPIEDFISN